jgi:outer membrane lipoprotein SlyB
MRKLVLAITAATMAMPVIPATTASAQSGYYNGRVWRDNHGRYRCRRPNGTVGLIVGGAAGGLLGNAVDGGRNRTAGTLLGAAGGALLGRHVARHSGSRRCR